MYSNEALKTEAIIIDDLLETEVGPIGIWQWSLVLLGVLSTTAASTFSVFADTVPLRRCYMGDQWETAFVKNNLSFEQIGLMTGGWTSTDAMQSLTAGCQRFAGQWDNSTVPDILDPNQSLTTVPGLTNQTVSCPQGYVYMYLPFQYNGGIVETFDMVCDKSWFIPIGTAVFMVGMMLGYLFCGFWSARFGLKHALISFSMLELVASTCSSFSHAFWLYTLLRFVVAIGAYGKLSSFNIILLELTVPRYRSLINAVYLMGFNCTSLIILSFFAHFLTNWRFLNLVVTFPCLLVFAYFWLVPESPRWLLTQGRALESIGVLKRGSIANRRFTSCDRESGTLDRYLAAQKRDPSRCTATVHNADCIVAHSDRSHGNGPNSHIVFKLFSSVQIIQTTAIATVLFFLYSFLHTCLMLYTLMLRIPVHVFTLMIAMLAVPGAVVCITAFRLTKHRRTPIVCTYLFIGIILCFGGVYTYIVHPEDKFPLSICLILSLILMVTVQSMMFIYVPELYGPEIRSQGFGTSAGLGQTGSLLSIFVHQMDYTVEHGIPIVICAVVAICSALLTLCLNDTMRSDEQTPTSAESDGQELEHSCGCMTQAFK